MSLPDGDSDLVNELGAHVAYRAKTDDLPQNLHAALLGGAGGYT